jgi:phospholipid-binding lipoprotein MlaA
MRTIHPRPSIPPTSLFVLSALLSALAGCSTAPVQELAKVPPKRPASAVLKAEVEYPLAIYDPLEPFNRRIYKFNALFDEYVFLPLVDTYEFIAPQVVESAISNFFSNLSEITVFINSLLQTKFARVATTGARFVINSTVGLAGLWDPATSLGIKRQHEDFGQTLGFYGLGPGPYLVLPIMGPSNLRDGTGWLVDTLSYGIIIGAPFDFGDHTPEAASFYSVGAIDTRHQIAFRYYQMGSPFEYDLIRYLYTKKREINIAN